MHPYIHCSIIIAKMWKEPKCPSVDELIQQMWNTHTCARTHTMEYYSAIRKNETLPFAITWMDPEGIKLSELNQTEKDKYCMSLIYGI